MVKKLSFVLRLNNATTAAAEMLSYVCALRERRKKEEKRK